MAFVVAIEAVHLHQSQYFEFDDLGVRAQPAHALAQRLYLMVHVPVKTADDQDQEDERESERDDNFSF